MLSMENIELKYDKKLTVQVFWHYSIIFNLRKR